MIHGIPGNENDNGLTEEKVRFLIEDDLRLGNISHRMSRSRIATLCQNQRIAPGATKVIPTM
jgi:hypothetical protein